MKYYFIYSAGGGAGDWNGVKRVWNQYMPTEIKSHILLKFGDIFLEHATGTNFVRPQRWREITNLRDWLADNVNDTFVKDSNSCDILLDSGTSKAVNNIAHHNPGMSCDSLIETFDSVFENNRVFEKYVNVVFDSQINSAVTFDIPNPFKIRSQNGDARLNILDREANTKMVELSAAYSNRLFQMLSDKGGIEYASNTLMTIINGLWDEEEIYTFLNNLCYKPSKLAIGAMSSNSTTAQTFNAQIDTLKSIGLDSYTKLHFLGCGGFNKVSLLKNNHLDNDNISVDCSTFFNRSIDGSTSGNSQSGYYDYASRRLIRIKPNTKNEIITLHNNSVNPLYSTNEIEEILDLILEHQSGNSSVETYNARAKLSFHNFDVFKRFAQ